MSLVLFFGAKEKPVVQTRLVSLKFGGKRQSNFHDDARGMYGQNRQFQMELV